MLSKPRIYLFISTHLINPIIHEHSCKILYLNFGGWLSWYILIQDLGTDFPQKVSSKFLNSRTILKTLAHAWESRLSLHGHLCLCPNIEWPFRTICLQLNIIRISKNVPDSWRICQNLYYRVFSFLPFFVFFCRPFQEIFLGLERQCLKHKQDGNSKLWKWLISDRHQVLKGVGPEMGILIFCKLEKFCCLIWNL